MLSTISGLKALRTSGLLKVSRAIPSSIETRRVAFLCGDESLSFAELECRSNAVAHGLLAADIRPGAHVAYLGCINW